MKTLKVLLWIMAVVYLLAFLSSFLPLDTFNLLMKPFDMDPLPDSTLLSYAYKILMLCAAVIGVFLIVMARDPKKHKKMIKLVGWASILIAAYMLFLTFFVFKFENRWFYADPIFYLIFGVAIVKLIKKHG
ncbi:hypothetical protein HQ544_02710 [Candidatus Falkowbacteria bacterium]|nr:hypothetical protein [Candidatus Falkowbacteria bacterium]